MRKRKTLSRTLIESAKDLGFSKITVDQLKSLSIPEVRDFAAKDIRRLREQVNASQGVFAALLNVNPSTVQKWEQGTARPQNAALKLLNVLEAHGVGVLKE